MVILPSNRTEILPIELATDDPRCIALANKYGSADNFYLQVTNNEPVAETPSMVLAMMTYGQPVIVRQLASRMKMAALRMGETAMDSTDAELIAQSIADDPKARTLAYDLVMGFFKCIERGLYSLYSCKPRQVMEAWQEYAHTAHDKMNKMRHEVERKKADQEWEEHHRQCITLAEFKRRQQAT